MKFWTNFAKNGEPGISTNGVEWTKYNGQVNIPSSYMILDNKRNLKMNTDEFSFSSLVRDLHKENALTNLEKCVVLLQMLTYVGDDLYDDYVDDYPSECDRVKSEQFIKDNSSFIDF